MLHTATRRAAFSALTFLLVAAIQAQSPQQTWHPHAVPAPASMLQTFQVAAATVQDLAVPPVPTTSFELELDLGGRVVTLALAPHNLRTNGFQLLVDDGQSIHPVAPGNQLTWQGVILGQADTAVAVSLQNGQLKGVLRDDRGLWGLQPATESDPQAPRQRHCLYQAADNWLLPYTCGVQGLANGQPGPGGSADIFYQTDLALEVDYPHYLRFNNVTTAQNDVMSVVNAMDVIYRRDCQITFLVGTVLVRTAADPYSTTDAGTLLGQFQGWWNAYQGGVSRDVAMLFTGRSINGNVIGIAFVAQVCNLGAAYGLTETMYNGLGTNMTMRVGLIAHEMGHLWSAQHCDGGTDCRIMCSGLGGCSGNVSSFSAGEIAQIVGYRSTAPCLTPLSTPPVMTGVTPSVATAFTPGTLTITGTGFTGVNQVSIGTQTFSTGLQLINDTQLRVTPPDGAALGLQGVTVHNASGTSNPMLILYTETHPCELVVPTLVLGGTNLTFRFGGRAAKDWFLMVSLFNTTSLVQGLPVLNSCSVLTMGNLGGVGIGNWSVPIPPVMLSGLRAYTQVLEVEPTTMGLISTSNVGSTLIFN